MGQDSKSGGRGLYVDSIEVDPEGGESVLFPCQSWSEDDDLKHKRISILKLSLQVTPNQVRNSSLIFFFF